MQVRFSRSVVGFFSTICHFPWWQGLGLACAAAGALNCCGLLRSCQRGIADDVMAFSDCCRVRRAGAGRMSVTPPNRRWLRGLPFRPAFGEFEEFVGGDLGRVVLDLPTGEVEPCLPQQ